ncbi:MAG: hypothetical protein JNL69_04710 [Bacteroidia bacterium]|nr:hypothetical protein [Bacteroidia bacterium]
MKIRILLFLSSLFFIACNFCDEENKETAPPVENTPKYIIKAANMQFISIGSDSILIANQSDPSKAEEFELIDVGNGKSGFISSTERLVSANFTNNDMVDVIRTKVGDWEQFEIIYLDSTRVNIKACNGKFLSADLASEQVKIIANRDVASLWEVFEMIKK